MPAPLAKSVCQKVRGWSDRLPSSITQYSGCRVASRLPLFPLKPVKKVFIPFRHPSSAFAGFWALSLYKRAAGVFSDEEEAFLITVAAQLAGPIREILDKSP